MQKWKETLHKLTRKKKMETMLEEETEKQRNFCV